MAEERQILGTKEPITRLVYCQYLLVSQINYTLTSLADHCETIRF